MSKETFFPYPPRPGLIDESSGFDTSRNDDLLNPEALQTVINFENQLYSAELDPVQFPTAEAYKREQEAKGRPLLPIESVWQTKINSHILGVSYFLTDEGRQFMQETTGVELVAISVEDCTHQLSSLDISKIPSDVLGKLEDASVGFEEGRLTRAFIDSGFDGQAVPEPHFLEIYKNPEVILEKARGYRQLKTYITKAIDDLKSSNPETDPSITAAEMLLAQLYLRRLNMFIAETYVVAHKFAYQAQHSNRNDYRELASDLEVTLPAFYQNPDPAKVARFLVRMDRYINGVDRDQGGKFTWLNSVAQSFAAGNDQQADEQSVDREMYDDIKPSQLAKAEITSTEFGELLKSVLNEHSLLSDYATWDSERESPAPDGKWQVIVDGRFKSLAVDDKQRIVRVPDKPTTLLRGVSVGSHELTHVLQFHNMRLIGKLAILKRIGLDGVSEQTESGGLWQEREARAKLTGTTKNKISGTGYLKSLEAKQRGSSFGEAVKLYHEDLLNRDPDMSPEKAVAQAVNRAQRAYRSGGFEYARDLPILTNSQPLRYLEQELVFRNLTSEQRRILFIYGVSISNLTRLSQLGLVDLDRVFIPEKRPLEIMYPHVKILLASEHR